MPALKQCLLGPIGRSNIIAGFRATGFYPFNRDAPREAILKRTIHQSTYTNSARSPRQSRRLLLFHSFIHSLIRLFFNE